MAFNGSGTYLPITPPDFPAVAGTTIRATQYNNQVYDFAAALTGVVCKDGQTTPTANLPMGNFRHTGVGAATARTQYARAAEVQDGALTWLTSVAGADTITAVASAGMLAYAAGQTFKFAAVAANTGAVTLNVNSVGAKAVKDSSGNALTAGELVTGRIVSVVYNGTEFRLLEANLAAALPTLVTKTSATGDAAIPAGTTAQRDGSPSAGYLRFNTSDDTLEYADNVGAYVQLEPAAVAVAAGIAAHVAETDPHTQYVRKLALASVAASGGAVVFSAVPAWVNKISIRMSGVDLSGTADLMVQLGDSGGMETSGYSGSASVITSSVSTAIIAAGLNFTQAFGSHTTLLSAVIEIFHAGGNLWVAQGAGGLSGVTATFNSCGSKQLSDVLTQFQIVPNAADTFASGTVHVTYEG